MRLCAKRDKSFRVRSVLLYFVIDIGNENASDEFSQVGDWDIYKQFVEYWSVSYKSRQIALKKKKRETDDLFQIFFFSLASDTYL